VLWTNHPQWANQLGGSCPEEVVRLSFQNDYDFFFLTHFDVPYERDYQR
jgi:hypothetical protein